MKNKEVSSIVFPYFYDENIIPTTANFKLPE